MADIFAHRSTETEIMDDLAFEGPIIDTTLKELHTINTWLGGNNVIISGLRRLLDEAENQKMPDKITIADLGCGGGDLLKLVALWARRKNLKIELTGIDANPYIVRYAQQNSSGFPEIKYRCMNIFSKEFQDLKFDVFTCTLFCHHFEDTQLIELFSQLKSQCRLGIVVNDIHRHWFAYHSIKWLTAVFSKSMMVKNDAKVSVLRAFRKKELSDFLNKGGFKKNDVTWKWAFRFQAVGWK